MTEPSPFDVLEPMLATEGMENRARGYQLIFKPFVLTPASVAPLRARILDLAFGELHSPNLRRAVRAADAIGHALRYPYGYFGQEVDTSDREAWTPEFVSTLSRLAEHVQRHDLDPVVIIAVRSAIRWHADYSRTATRDAAKRVLHAMPWRQQDELALALFDGWGHLTEDREHDFERAHAERSERMGELAHRLTAANGDDELVRQLDERLMAQSASGSTRGHPGPFVWALVAERPSLGAAIADAVATDPMSQLLEVVPVALAALAEHGHAAAVPAITRLLDSGQLSARQQVAQALGSNRGARATLLEGELDILERLATDTDVYVRTCVVRAAQRLSMHHPDVAVRLLAAVPFADSTVVADELFQVIGPQGDLDWRQLPPVHVRKLLAELELCPSIEGYWIMAFLADISSDRPAELVELLLRRVDRSEHADSMAEYRAVPFNWDHELRVRGTSEFPTILRQIRDWIAARPDVWQRRDSGAEAFKALAGVFDDTVMAILEEGARTGHEGQMIAVGAILRQAPPTFAFDHVDFVRRLLDLASQLGEEHVRRIGGALSAAAGSEVRSGVAGQPFAEDVTQRDRAREIADALPPGSREQRVYRSLQRSAEDSIEWHADRDDSMDGRDW